MGKAKDKPARTKAPKAAKNYSAKARSGKTKRYVGACPKSGIMRG